MPARRRTRCSRWGAPQPSGRPRPAASPRRSPRSPAEERLGNACRRTVGAMTTIFVTGATGTVGRHVAPQLVRRGLSVRALVRNPAADLPTGVGRIAGGLADAASSTPALDGVAAVYLACGNPPAQAAWEIGVIDAAA